MSEPAEIVVRPQPGPQEAFAACGADVVFYGGAAGGGKSWALRFEVMRGIHLLGYTGIIFRRTSPELTAPGGMWDQAEELYSATGGVSRDHPRLDWRWPSGAAVKFSHLQLEKDKKAHQGAEYCYVGFDELPHFTETQFWYLWSRNRSVCGMRPYLRATMNPEPDSWVRKFIDWWIGADGLVIPERSGVIRWFIRLDDEIEWADEPGDLIALQARRGLTGRDLHDPQSFTFIAANLDDNPALTSKDPGYRGRLQALSRVERARLLGGDWNIKPAAGLIFQRAWSPRLTVEPRGIVQRVRCWDLAATKPTKKNRDPDWTVGVLMGAMRDGRFVILDVVRMRGSPGEVEATVQRTALADGREVTVGLWQDPGQAGKAQIQHYTKKVLRGFAVKVTVAREGKQTYWNPVSAAMENGLIDHMETVSDKFWGVLEEAPDGSHDDDADALALCHILTASRPVYGYHPAPADRSRLEI